MFHVRVQAQKMEAPGQLTGGIVRRSCRRQIGLLK